MGQSYNSGIVINGNNSGSIASGEGAFAIVTTTAGTRPVGDIIAELRNLMREHGDELDDADRMSGRGALAEIEDELIAPSPRKSRLAAAVDTFRNAVGPVTALVTATSELSDSVQPYLS